MDYKDIHIGSHIKRISEIRHLTISRACTYLKCSHKDILNMYNQKTLDSGLLLKWCKLLDYNFFMFYHSHLQLYRPSASLAKVPNRKKLNKTDDQSYNFRKNLYSPDIIDWLLDKLNKEEISIKSIINQYNIPKTTIYRWKKKYSKD